ncbi:hypothetical protein AZI86_10550 [Bdellovibrio bacteriovorus]|uniref:Peptidase M43 pregnancy-associated plasma-A domain-containing protein n=1 Tax=Bdellovibrio bacteriovorus TaxID=959 RepID=A0A150WLI2_BDEBC|nr:M43 family zinc metalloprotease [Bdellovibrio bacteriovorus]KYG64647.1 hypothetical protein AZI86_10550 [Bdellovibrio bacteriovorus]
MMSIARILYIFILTLGLQSSFVLAATYQDIKDIKIVKEGSYWVSEWVDFEIPANTASFQINAFSSPEEFIQVTDLIAPDGTYFVQSDSGKKLTPYSQPILRNVLSLNRTLAVIKGMSSTLVPNNPILGAPRAGLWKMRTLTHYQPLMKSVSFEIVVKSQEELAKNNVDIRVLISPDSYWTREKGHVEKVIARAKESLAEAGLNLRTLSITMLAQKTPEPMDLPSEMVAIAESKNQSDAVNVYMMPSMQYQNKPINGLACIGGAIDLKTRHACFVSMYADQRGDEISLENQGKILAHEIGHYLGLFHTKDDGYYGIGAVYDKLDDTSEIITGANMMDPGIHDETPHFSKQQKQMLRLSPALR